MALKKIKESEDEVSVTINLKELFGKPVGSSTIRGDIAENFISEILSRTSAGYGVYDNRLRRFPKYSIKYAVKKDVSRTSVDLTDLGDMLGSLTMLDNGPDFITIGIAGDQAPKAHGHQTGQYGAGPLPARPFIDFTDQELGRVKKLSLDLIREATTNDVLKSDNEEVRFTDADIRSAIALLKKK